MTDEQTSETKALVKAEVNVSARYELNVVERALLMQVYEECIRLEGDVKAASEAVQQAHAVLNQLDGARTTLLNLWMRQCQAVLSTHGLSPVEKDGTTYEVDPIKGEIRAVPPR